jgi:hypothetical protein
MMTGRRCAQVNECFVVQDAREQSVEHAIIEALSAEAVKRDWIGIRWLVPDKPPIARELAERFAHPGGWIAYTLEIRR